MEKSLDLKEKDAGFTIKKLRRFICRAEIETPVNLSTKQKKLISEFNDSLIENNNPK